ncbi:MAG: hypothetical protein J0I48_21590, partial [Devosia sp.]|nr:hypothetical protein [Devosia sp.]
MNSNFFVRSRKWIGASALAILVGLGGGTAFLAATTPMVVAQVQPAAQVTVPETNPALGFADLVDAVKPAVVSIIVQGRDAPAQNFGDEFDPRFPDLPEDNPLRKFFEQFVLIAEALNEQGMWNEEDKFFYDTLSIAGSPMQLRIQSIVGLTTLFAVSIIEKKTLLKLADFKKRINW